MGDKTPFALSEAKGLILAGVKPFASLRVNGEGVSRIMKTSIRNASKDASQFAAPT